MLVSSEIIDGFAHGKGNIKIGQPALARPFANQHAKAILRLGRCDLAFYLGMDDLTLQAEVELATLCNAKAATDLHRDNDLALIGNGDGEGLHLDRKSVV